MAQTSALQLETTHLRLRPDSSIEPLPVDAQFWARIASGKLGSFRTEYLVSCHAFSSDWPSWEMHACGDEVVCLLSGRATFVLEAGGVPQRVELQQAGAFVIVPRGVWHTAQTTQACRMLFITAGEGTQHRAVAVG